MRAVLLDRDGTLVHDVGYHADPDRLAPVPGAADAVRRLRAAGLRVGLVTNQSAIGRGLVTATQVDAVHARLAELVGRFDTVQVCPHPPDAGCGCRKPAAGLVTAAARALRVATARTVVIGDIGADMAAAHSAGARAVLVPTAATRPEEIARAPVLAATLAEAVDLVLRGRLG